jgi:hypothetical protein
LKRSTTTVHRRNETTTAKQVNANEDEKEKKGCATDPYITTQQIKISLNIKKGWKVKLSKCLIPILGLLEPCSCKAIIWPPTATNITKGNKKCKAKNLCKVALETL